VSKVKPCKIDQDDTYPCPCRKQGQLCPITLTEALGCHRCQHIFIIHSDGYILEQLSGTYPYKQLWHWTGQEWTPIKSKLRTDGCVLIVGISSCLLILLLCLTRVFAGSVNDARMVWVVVGILPVCLFAGLVWLTIYRRL
jgi:hypothetical protein